MCRVLHVRNAHYISAAATGVSVTGPADDGYLHLHFFRETQRIDGETIPVRVSDSDGRALGSGCSSMQIRRQREEVATISIDKDVFLEIAEGLAKLASLHA